VEVYIHALLTSSVDGSEWSASRPSHFIPEKIASGIYWMGGPHSRSGSGKKRGALKKQQWLTNCCSRPFENDTKWN